MGLLRQLSYQYASFKCRPARVRACVEEVCALYPSKGSYKRGALRVSAVSIQLRECRALYELVTYLYRFVREGVINGSKLVCLPEYTGLLALPLLPFYKRAVRGIHAGAAATDDSLPRRVRDLIEGMTPAIQNAWLITCSELARRCAVYIMAGSALLMENGRLVNRAVLFDDSGRIVGAQDKLHLSDFEERCGVTPGTDVGVFNTRFGRVAFPIGTDCRFFEEYRLAANKGAELVICPIATTTEGSYQRELRGFECRVQENCFYGVKSTLVGDMFGVSLTGRAAVFGPLKLTHYQDGIVAISPTIKNSVVITAEINLDMAAAHTQAAKEKYNAGLTKAQLHAAYAEYFARTEPARKTQRPGGA